MWIIRPSINKTFLKFSLLLPRMKKKAYSNSASPPHLLSNNKRFNQMAVNVIFT